MPTCRTAASATATPGTEATPSTVAVALAATTTAQTVPTVSYEAPKESANAATITLGSTIAVSGSGASVVGNTVKIASAGTYAISGTSADGQIVVDTADEELVKLVLSGASITSATTAPINVVNGKTTTIVLADGTQNRVADASAYAGVDPESGEPDAAIFSTGDLTISGNGSLAVDANFKHGIASKDELRITGGSVTVDAVGDGIRGRDFVAIKDGIVTVTAGQDGIQSNNDEDPGKGFVAIEGGAISITATLDGIQAETSVVVSGGHLTISSGGGSAKAAAVGTTGGTGAPRTTAASAGESAKGIKGLVGVTIRGGTLAIDSADDALHSNDSLRIEGGDIRISTGDDALHADTSLAITGGKLAVTKAYEGVESKAIAIDGGEIRMVTSDDAINVASGDGAMMMGRPGQAGTFTQLGSQYLEIGGGYVSIQAGGDGFDVNGAIMMTGGTVLISGPTSNGNGSLDYDAGFKMTGGLLVAAGSSGMAQAPDASSTVNNVVMTFPSVQPANTMVHVQTQSGEDVLTFVPTTAFQTLVLASPSLKSGTTYVVYSGGSSTGTAVDGLYSGEKYSEGTQAASFTVSAVVTRAGSAAGGMSGMGAPGGRR